jgi:hypothetical protein
MVKVLGFRQFSMRGLAKAQAEWKLVCTSLNLRRMATLVAAWGSQGGLRADSPLAHARNLGHPNTSPTLTPTLSRQRERGNFIRRDR